MVKLTKHSTPSRYWWIAALKALEDLGGKAHKSNILRQVESNNKRSMAETSVRGGANIALINTSCLEYTTVQNKIYEMTLSGRKFLHDNLSIYEDFNK